MSHDGFIATISVDGTDFLVNEPFPFDRGFYSHKLKHAAFRYEVGICLMTGWIVHIYGPFPAGHWPDKTIFRHCLKHHLQQNEKVIADKGYRNEPKCLTPNDTLDPVVVRRMSIARARHEGINGMFKNFFILKHQFRHPRQKHGSVFGAITVITQMIIEQGGGTYQLINNNYPPPPNPEDQIERGVWPINMFDSDGDQISYVSEGTRDIMIDEVEEFDSSISSVENEN